MFRKSKQTFLALAALGALALGGSALAGAATSSSSGNSSPSGNAPRHPNETALTGTTATKVREAALAKVPGTVVRVETDDGGVYEAHVRRSDGSETEVKVDRDFKVSAVEEHAGPGRGGGHPNETALTGTTATKVREAALAKVPGTVVRVETDDGGVYEAHVRRSDGSEAEVKVDRDFKVSAVEEHERP